MHAAFHVRFENLALSDNQYEMEVARPEVLPNINVKI